MSAEAKTRGDPPDSSELAPTALHREIEEFLYREAWILDNDKLEQWLDLFSENVRYWAPVRRSLPRGRESFHDAYLTPHFDDNKAGLSLRVARSRTGLAHAEEGTRQRRFVTNILILEVEGDFVRVSSNFQVFKSRQDEQWFVGTREDRIRRKPGGGWSIEERMIVLDHGVIGSITTYI